MILGPGDVAEAEDREKVAAALARYSLEEAQDEAGFDEGFRVLDEVFGPRGELERREVLDIWFGALRRPPERWASSVTCRYHLLLARDRDGALAGVRDCFVTLDASAGRCVVLLSHTLVLGPHRRSGLASLLRAAPAALARRGAEEAGLDPRAVEIVLFAEMEPVAPAEPDTVVRLIAYGRAGFRVIPPEIFPYVQPDFRDLAALGEQASPLPLIAVIRQVGHEDRAEMPRERAEACLRHVHAIHACDNRLEDIAAIQEHTRRALAAFAGETLPLLPLPRSGAEIQALGPLVRSAVLPLYPAAWRGAAPLGDPEQERAALRAAWSPVIL